MLMGGSDSFVPPPPSDLVLEYKTKSLFRLYQGTKFEEWFDPYLKIPLDQMVFLLFFSSGISPLFSMIWLLLCRISLFMVICQILGSKYLLL